MPQINKPWHRGLAPAMHPYADEAQSLGLFLAHYNSGTRENSLNGFRIFRGTAARDFFAGGHIAHLSDGSAVDIFLQGYRFAKRPDGGQTA